MELRETTWNVLEDAGTSLKWKCFLYFNHSHEGTWNNPSPTPATWGPNCPEVSVKGSWWLPNSKYCHYDQHAHWRMPLQERVREAVGEWERSDKQFHVRQKMGFDYWVAMSVRLMVSTHGPVVPLAIFSSCLRSFDRNFGPNQRSILFQNCVWLPSIQDHLQVMRDHPNHGSKILGGLWGGSNYMNMSLAVQARLDSFETLSWNRFFPKDPFSRAALYSVPMSSRYGYDLDVLERRVWPLIRWEVTIGDTLCLRIGVLEDI